MCEISASPVTVKHTCTPVQVVRMVLGQLAPSALNAPSPGRDIGASKASSICDDADSVYSHTVLNAEDVSRIEGKYTVLSTVGAGSFGTAYLASTYSSDATDALWKRILERSDRMVSAFDESIPKDGAHPMREPEEERPPTSLPLLPLPLSRPSPATEACLRNICESPSR